MKRIAAVLALASCAAFPHAALAWGSTGHLMINRIGAERLPADVPAFVRSASAIDEISALGAEEDRLKGAGASWDADFDPGHFLDIDDNGKIAGLVNLAALPASMEAYGAALATAGTDPYRMGFLPYSIIDGFERVRKDFAIWRVDEYLASHALTAAARAHYTADRTFRQSLALRDIGVWGHFIADGSQPLHVTIHYNGWGAGENPKHYTNDRTVHATFESTFVSAHVSADTVRKHVTAYAAPNDAQLWTQTQIAAYVGAYLSGSANAVPTVYDLWNEGAFERATPAAIDFTATQLARGASTYRDLIALAWLDSLNESVGYPAVQVRDILKGIVVLRDPAD